MPRNINLKIYKLVDNYTDNFTAINENNSESLFEVQYAYGIQAGNELGCNRAKFMGLPVDGCSWDDSTPRTALKGDFEQEKTTDGKVDPRLKATLAFMMRLLLMKSFMEKHGPNGDLIRIIYIGENIQIGIHKLMRTIILESIFGGFALPIFIYCMQKH